MNNISEQAFKSAVNEIETMLDAKVLELILRGWSYYLTEDAPETWDALMKYKASKRLPIASHSSDSAIYSSADYNYKFRFWHDVTHLELNADFSYEGEILTAEKHLKEGQEWGLSELAIDILKADSVGQVEYYHHHDGLFVDNQEAFVQSCLRLGIRKAIAYKH